MAEREGFEPSVSQYRPDFWAASVAPKKRGISARLADSEMLTGPR